MATQAKPLRGLRVLEMARTLAGPWMGQILADLGADVVKIERPGIGDETRNWGPPYVKDAEGKTVFASYFQACNRGKRSVEADFAQPQGRALIERLVSAADIVIENFKAGTLKRHGLDAKVLCELNPRLIWCSITAFGQTGPYAARPGYDFIIQAVSGILEVNGLDLGRPRRLPLPTSDLFTGVYGVVAVLAALNQRAATGRGTLVDLSLLDTQISVMSQYFVGQSMHAETEPGNPHHSAAVPQFVVPAADGNVALVVATDLHFQSLAAALGCASLSGDPRFKDNAVRRANLADMIDTLGQWTSRLGTADIVARLERIGVPAGRVNSLSDAICDPQVSERKIVVELPTGELGAPAAPAIRMPILFDGQAALPESGAPKLGEHNAEIVSDPNWSAKRSH